MKRILLYLGLVCLIGGILVGVHMMRAYTYELSYDVLSHEYGYELRAYDVYVVAETRVSNSYTDAVAEGVHRLSAYINGNNETHTIIPATRPILIEKEEAQQENFGSDRDIPETYKISFVMPRDTTFDTLPVPTDVRIITRVIPQSEVFVKSYHVLPFGSVFGRKSTHFIHTLATHDIAVSHTIESRMSAPYAIPFLTRNELWAIEE